MAELAPQSGWTRAQTRAQFGAVAWLRWRIVRNAFRRKGGAGEIAARIILYPILAALALVPTLGAGAAAFYLVHTGRADRISVLLWVTFGLCQLLNIQLGQPGTTFDPTQLVRFPLSSRGYTAVRLCFGLLTPANVIGSMMSLAVAVGAGLGDPGLWAYALGALGVFAAANVLFSRMIFAWVDRWLATRRAREIFTTLIFVFSIGIQYLNFTYNPAYNHGHRPAHRLTAVTAFYRRVRPYVRLLPPELAARSLTAAQQGSALGFGGETLGDAAWAAVFLAVFALRMRTEFRGESLSDAANSVARPKKTPKAVPSPAAGPAAAPFGAAAQQSAARRPGALFLHPTAAAQWGKELLYVRRNQGILFAMVMPIVVAAFLIVKWSARSSAGWVFPAALAYMLMGLIPLSFNSWGLEGAGAQLYFLAPVRIRDVMLGKNLMSFTLAAAEVVVMLGVVTYIGQLPPLLVALPTLLWVAGTLLFSTALGNRRSLTSPKKVSLTSMNRSQTSQLSGLISLGIMLAAIALGTAVLLPAMYFHVQWVLLPAFAAYAGAGLWVYQHFLNAIDSFAQTHREELFLELCKPD
jgi:ABC-2 type transport system permease protein